MPPSPPSSSALQTWFIRTRPVETVEAVLGVVLVAGLDLLIPAAWGLNHLDLFALWVVVLAIAARHGAPAGYVGGALAALAFYLLLAQNIDPTAPLAAMVQIQPFLLFTAGVLVSEVVRARKRQEVQTDARYRRATAALADLGQQLEIAREAQRDLERRIAVQPTSLALALDQARGLAAASRETAPPLVLAMLRDLLGAERCALYRIEMGADSHETLRLSAGLPEGWAGRPASLVPAGPVVGRALRERRVVSVREAILRDGLATMAHASGPRDGQATLTRETVLLAGPLLGEDGAPFALVVVEALPFTRFTPSAVAVLEALLGLASVSMRGALVPAGQELAR